MAIGFGIIGCGMIAKFHARAIADIKGAKLVACYNRTPDKAHALAAEFGGEAVEDLDALLARPDIDVVTICTASGAHMEPVIAAAKAGKHVIVEKPLDVTLKRCDAMIAACEKAGVQLGTIFPSRFHQSSLLLKKAVDDGRFGRLTLGDAYVKWYRTQAYYDSGAWRGTWKLDGGGALMNQAIHSVDLLLWLMGPAVEVSAHTATLGHERIEVEDVATATIRFASGALGVIEATTAAYPGSLKKIEISGTAGMAVLEEENLIKWEFAKPTKRDQQLRDEMLDRTKTGGGASDPAAIGHHAHAALFRDFLKSVKNGTRPSTHGLEGRRSVELILAIYKSAKTGRPVKLPMK
jgi:UDP-N-acetyl-2-amino-2-deoxyglucuronate dehydrogenase